MRFTATSIAGVVVVELEPIEDHRGFFARLWSVEDFAAAGLDFRWAQCNVGQSPQVGTIRGLHYQEGDAAETKLVWCGVGSVFDVAIDLRSTSPTFGQWIGVELTSDNMQALLMPPGTAHGYQTLQADTQLWYLSDHPYDGKAATGIRWDDPAFDIGWPLPPGPMSDQDRDWPLTEGLRNDPH